MSMSKIAMLVACIGLLWASALCTAPAIAGTDQG